MSKINLMIDEENELTFQVQIEGTRPGQAKCRLMIESNDMSLAFGGASSGGQVTVTLPPLDHILKEGVYDMSLEVLVDDRYFEPLKVQGEFEKRLKVTAESVKVKTKPAVRATATLLETKTKEEPVIKVTSKPRSRPTNVPVTNSSSPKTLSDKDIRDLISQLSRRG